MTGRISPAIDSPGTVALIGAGPGDPGLITLRGAELLGRADVVLYDGLCNPDLLRHAPSAQHICVGKHGQSRIWQQPEIIAEIMRQAAAGKRVVRLKGGDPAVFARTAEEVDALRAAEINYEIVPGVTAALAAGSFAGIPITHRGIASAVALVTGHEEPGKADSALDWAALADFPGTLVVYMGVTTAPVWTAALIAAGKPADTPAAIVRRCSLPDQQTVRCRLDQIAATLEAKQIRPPAIAIVGPVTELAESMRWAERRPLFGKTILVTRPAEQADALAGPLRELGATVLLQPAIAIKPLADWTAVDAAINGLRGFDDVVFCSHNGVKFFMDRLFQLNHDARELNGLRVAVVGAKTADSLRQYGIVADVVPADYRAESLVDELADSAAGRSMLIIRASRGRQTLAESLTRARASVTQIIAYQHVDVSEPDPHIRQWADQGRIDWLTVTSSATAASIAKLFGSSLGRMKIASLSPVTSETVRQTGYPIATEANPYTIESLIDAIVRQECS